MRNKHTACTRATRRTSKLAALLLAGLVAGQWASADSGDRSAAGKALATDRAKGNCLACHVMGDGEQPGTLGPPLLAMDRRYPDRELLQRQICDATERNPHSRMPPFCRHGILTGDEVELIVDYLYTL
jgi:sulfur-oxidizing protein SoxX